MELKIPFLRKNNVDDNDKNTLVDIGKSENISLQTSVTPDILPPTTLTLTEGPHNSIVPNLPFPMIELYDLYYSCTELRTTLDKITGTAFRNGFEIVPRYYYKCDVCGNEVKYKPLSTTEKEKEYEKVTDEELECDVCHSKNSMVEPPPKERKVLAEWFNKDKWNINGESLEDIAKGFMFHYLVAENAYVILERKYTFKKDGSIDTDKIQEVSTADSYLMYLIGNKSGRLSHNAKNQKLYVCPIHRSTLLTQTDPDFLPHCVVRDCIRKPIIAVALAFRYYGDKDSYVIYGENEIIRTNGYSVRTRAYSISKIYTLKEKLIALIGLSKLFAERMATGNPLNTIVFVKTSNIESLKSSVNDIQRQSEKNRYSNKIIGINSTTDGNISEVVNIDSDLADLQLNEMRKDYARDVYDMYNVEPIECFTVDHDVMTRNGFVPISQIKENDEIATLKDNKVEFHKPNKIMTYPYNGEVYDIVTKYVSLCVTKEHNLYCRSSNSKNYKTRKPDNLPPNTDMKIDFPYRNYDGVNGLVDVDGEKYELEALAKLYILFYRHGRLSRDRIYFDKKSVYKLTTIMKKLGIWHEENDDTVYVINNPKLAKLFSTGGIPEVFLTGDIRVLEYIIDKITIGKLSGNKTLIRHRTDNLNMANTLQEAALKCGYTSKIKPDSFTNENDYRVYISTRKGSHDTNVDVGKSMNKTQYIGKVYCLDVPNHTLYVRRDGKCVWSGNSTTGDNESANATVAITNSEIEQNQKFATEKLFDPLVKSLGVNEWRIVPKKVEITDKLREAQILGVNLDNIQKLTQSNFDAGFDSSGNVVHSKNPILKNETDTEAGSDTNLEETTDPSGSPSSSQPSDTGGTGQGSPSSGGNTSPDGRKGSSERNG